MGDWKPALEITLDQLDHATPDLRSEAALRLVNIFAELANPDQRPGLLDVLRKNKRAVERLSEYLQKAQGSRNHPLVLLGDFLQQQLGFQAPPSDEHKQ